MHTRNYTQPHTDREREREGGLGASECHKSHKAKSHMGDIAYTRRVLRWAWARLRSPAAALYLAIITVNAAHKSNCNQLQQKAVLGWLPAATATATKSPFQAFVFWRKDSTSIARLPITINSARADMHNTRSLASGQPLQICWRMQRRVARATRQARPPCNAIFSCGSIRLSSLNFGLCSRLN